MVVFLQVLDLQRRRARLHRRLVGLGALRQRFPVDLVEAHAAAEMPVAALDLDHRDFGGVAHPFHEVVAARAEIAALRPLVRQRQLAGNGDQRPRVLVCAGQRYRAEKPLRVGVAHMVEHVLDRPGLDRLARIHHRNAVAGFKDQAQIVRHEDHRRAELLAETLDQLHDAGLDGNVQRRRRLVEQQQRRLRQKRHRDHDALLLAA